jgi:CelD/BcsL family acetyltransferase involved in cellulose biosynthesis
MNFFSGRRAPRTQDTNLDIDVIRDPAAFRALQGAWQDLFARALRPHFFQRFDWLWDAWEQVAAPKGRQLFIVVGRVDGRVVLILPLTLYGPTF